MADLRDLYQEVILEHAKSPRNFHALEKPTVKAEGYNPLCGDRCTVYVAWRETSSRTSAFKDPDARSQGPRRR